MATIFDVLGIAAPVNSHTMILCDTFRSSWAKEGARQFDDIPCSLRHIFFNYGRVLSAIVASTLTVICAEFLAEISKELCPPTIDFVTAVLDDLADSVFLSLLFLETCFLAFSD